MSDSSSQPEIDLRPIERRFHFDPKFHELVTVMAGSIETRRFTLKDMEDAVTLLKHKAGLEWPRLGV